LAANERRPERPRPKFERLAAPGHDGERKEGAGLYESPHQGLRIYLALDREIAGDGHARRDLAWQRARCERFGGGGAIRRREGVAAGERGPAQFGFHVEE
jgi:hypothetical protein